MALNDAPKGFIPTPSDSDDAPLELTGESFPVDDRAPCPRCAEQIKIEALYCRFCGFERADAAKSPRAAQAPRGFAPEPEPFEEDGPSILQLAGIVAGAFTLLVVAFLALRGGSSTATVPDIPAVAVNSEDPDRGGESSRDPEETSGATAKADKSKADKAKADEADESTKEEPEALDPAIARRERELVKRLIGLADTSQREVKAWKELEELVEGGLPSDPTGREQSAIDNALQALESGRKTLAMKCSDKAVQALTVKDDKRFHEAVESLRSIGVSRFDAQIQQRLDELEEEKKRLAAEQLEAEKRAAEEQRKKIAAAEKAAAAAEEERIELIRKTRDRLARFVKKWANDRREKDLLCRYCDGAVEVQCKRCRGKGSKERSAIRNGVRREWQEPCPKCEGQGKTDCVRCDHGYRDAAVREAFWEILSPDARKRRDEKNFLRLRMEQSRGLYDSNVAFGGYGDLPIWLYGLCVKSARVISTVLHENHAIVKLQLEWYTVRNHPRLRPPPTVTTTETRWIKDGSHFYYDIDNAGGDPLDPKDDLGDS